MEEYRFSNFELPSLTSSSLLTIKKSLLCFVPTWFHCVVCIRTISDRSCCSAMFFRHARNLLEGSGLCASVASDRSSMATRWARRRSIAPALSPPTRWNGKYSLLTTDTYVTSCFVLFQCNESVMDGAPCFSCQTVYRGTFLLAAVCIDQLVASLV